MRSPDELRFRLRQELGNLAMFCLWSVAKPNYYLPCLPGVALLVGMAWVRICRKARGAVGSEANGGEPTALGTG